MKPKFLFLLALSICFWHLAQADDWHRGQLVLENGDILEGTISYDLDHEIVKLRQGDQIKAYGASQVYYFEFLDSFFNVKRTFFALPFSLQTGYKRPLFFELLVDGEFTLLTRERMMKRNQLNRHWLVSWPVSEDEVMANAYYLMDTRGNIQLINLRNIASSFTERRVIEKLRQFMQGEKFKPEKRTDMIRLFMYLNDRNTLV